MREKITSRIGIIGFLAFIAFWLYLGTQTEMGLLASFPLMVLIVTFAAAVVYYGSKAMSYRFEAPSGFKWLKSGVLPVLFFLTVLVTAFFMDRYNHMSATSEITEFQTWEEANAEWVQIQIALVGEATDKDFSFEELRLLILENTTGSSPDEVSRWSLYQYEQAVKGRVSYAQFAQARADYQYNREEALNKRDERWQVDTSQDSVLFLANVLPAIVAVLISFLPLDYMRLKALSAFGALATAFLLFVGRGMLGAVSVNLFIVGVTIEVASVLIGFAVAGIGTWIGSLMSNRKMPIFVALMILYAIVQAVVSVQLVQIWGFSEIVDEVNVGLITLMDARWSLLVGTLCGSSLKSFVPLLIGAIRDL